jgi:Arc/MetJ-type ribon-helix-helix transcriptional regulator
MSISLSQETQRLLEERVKAGGFSNVDDFVRSAVDAYDHVNALKDYEIDDETWDAIDRAEREYQHSGRGIPVDEAFAKLRQKLDGR